MDFMKEMLKHLDVDDIIVTAKTGEKSPTEALSEKMKHQLFVFCASTMFSTSEEERLKTLNEAEKAVDLSTIKKVFEECNPSLYELIAENLSEQQQKIVYCCLDNALRSKSISTLTCAVVLLEQVVKPLITTVNNLTLLTGKKGESDADI